jgi:type IV pilus assembly protein PilP
MIFTIGAFAAPADTAPKDFFQEKTKIAQPFQLRDPFKPPPAKISNEKQKAGYNVTSTGNYTNIEEATVTSTDTLKVVGVLIGKERRAMVNNGGTGPIIILKEGMKVGQEGAEVKAILPGGIILVEKITNVYGQEEYLETVIPISK